MSWQGLRASTRPKDSGTQPPKQRAHPTIILSTLLNEAILSLLIKHNVRHESSLQCRGSKRAGAKSLGEHSGTPVLRLVANSPVASPRSPYIFVQIPNFTIAPACPRIRIPHQRPIDSKGCRARRLDLLYVSTPRWEYIDDMAAPTYGDPFCF